MSEREGQTPEGLEEQIRIKAALESLFSSLDEYRIKSNRPVDALLTIASINHENSNDVFDFLVHPASPTPDGKPEIVIIKLYSPDGMLAEQLVARANWENSKPTLEEKELFCLEEVMAYDEEEIAVVSDEMIKQRIQKLEIEQGGKIFPLPPDFSKGVN